MLGVALLCSCDSPTGSVAQVCEPSATQGCPCAAGGEGVQRCQEDGLGWASCTCPGEGEGEGEGAEGEGEGSEGEGEGSEGEGEGAEGEGEGAEGEGEGAEGEGEGAEGEGEGAEGEGEGEGEGGGECRPGAEEVCPCGEEVGFRFCRQDGVWSGCRCPEGVGCLQGELRACPGGSDVGACAAGEQTCGPDGVWRPCVGQVGPVAEVCDGADNDCDGQVDEESEGVGEPCGSDEGECQSGVLACVGGQAVCEGEVPPGQEWCNGFDDDCDGETDEDPPTDGEPCGESVGACRPGVQRCVDGVSVCFGAMTPSPELCDSVDNDCDGLVDEDPIDVGIPCGAADGPCGAGTSECVHGELVCVYDREPPGEACDGQDNDCDGMVDEGCDGDGDGVPDGLDSCPETPNPQQLDRDADRLGDACDSDADGDEVFNDLDCDDLRPWIHPAAPELCDGLDTDCDGEGDVPGDRCRAAQLGAGDELTCVLTRSGAVHCWGRGRSGPHGVGAQAGPYAPSPVPGLEDGASELAVGSLHACARLGAAEVVCWGSNGYGELGDGTTEPRSEPVSVVGLGPGLGLALGAAHGCALSELGELRCWGHNDHGQLGDGTTTNRPLPVAVAGLPGPVEGLAAGDGHTCAHTAGGAVHCWGDNSAGQVGVPAPGDHLRPVAVEQLVDPVAALAAGQSHTCALTRAGEVWCWGGNDSGQLGDGTTDSREAPAPVELPGLATAIVAGAAHTCALDQARALHCWGDNGAGQLGDGTTQGRLAPVAVAGLQDPPVALAAGHAHTCAVTQIGSVRCWGSNTLGGLGRGVAGSTPIATEVRQLEDVVAAGAANFRTCAVTSDGSLHCWGANDSGQLGDGTTTARSQPGLPVPLDAPVSAVVGGHTHTCALTEAGGVWCWGDNPIGGLGDGTEERRSEPVAVVGLERDVAALTAGFHHSCAALVDGAVRGWGGGSFGELGNGGRRSRQTTPVVVEGLEEPATALRSGLRYTCAITAHGRVRCWGQNRHGTLGDGTDQMRLTPVAALGLGDVVQLTANMDHACALSSSGRVKCWGANRDGQLGAPAVPLRFSPGPVSGLDEPAVSVAAGVFHTCAALRSGAVLCWGDNGAGQLGDGSYVDSDAPVPVVGLGGPIVSVVAGLDHTCGVTDSGRMFCWGSGDEGQLGDGAAWSPLPAPVVGFGG